MTTQVLSNRLRIHPTDSATSRPLLSVVVPLFNEDDSLPELVRRLSHVVGHDAEIVFVNDGSCDRTPKRLDEFAAQDPRIVVIHFSRNFGHQAAISAGLAHATGQAIAIIDGDLQDPPELLPRMLEEWRAGAEVVYCIRERRQANPLKRLAYAGFYRLLQTAAEIDIPLDSGDFGLMDRKVVDAILSLPERSRFVRGLRAFVGFRQVGISYDRPAREAGQTKYSLSKLVRLAVDGLFDFSSLPIRLIGYSAAGLVFIALILGVVAVWNQSIVTGLFATTIGMGSMVVGSMAIVGEYVRKIFVEVKGRPTSIIRNIVRTSCQSVPQPVRDRIATPA